MAAAESSLPDIHGAPSQRQPTMRWSSRRQAREPINNKHLQVPLRRQLRFREKDQFKAMAAEASDSRAASSSRGFLRRIGAHEACSAPMWRAAATEMVATACLVFALTTTIISCFESGQTDPKLLVPVSIFFSGFPLLLATVPFTGGHMNPVFTFAVALKGGVSFVRAVSYAVAQCLGSLIAFSVVKATMDGGTVDKYLLGGCAVNGGGPGSGVGAGTALALEFACTFLLLYVAMPVFEERRRKELGLPTVCAVVAAVYGLVVYVSITVTGRAGYSGVGLHPARCWAAAVVYKGPLWEAHWVFWLGPVLACLVYHVFSSALPREELEKGDEEREEGEAGRNGDVERFRSGGPKDFEVGGF